MFRFMVLTISVGLLVPHANAQGDEKAKIAPRRSACELRLLKDASLTKTRAKDRIRAYEDVLDEQLDSGAKLVRNDDAANLYSDAQLVLSEIRRMQAGGDGRGLLDHYCKISPLSKPVKLD